VSSSSNGGGQYQSISCPYLHGNICDLCNQACLHPYDKKQQDLHRQECMQLIEKDMEEAFAAQRSAEKVCGICMEKVWEKEKEIDRLKLDFKSNNTSDNNSNEYLQKLKSKFMD
jgi:hypothetical protein